MPRSQATKKKATKTSTRSTATVSESEQSQLVSVSRKQEKRLEKTYEKNKTREERVEIDHLIEEVTMGRGIVSLVDKNFKEKLGIEGPYMATQVYNTRLVLEDNLKKLWAEMGRGEGVQSISIEHEVIVGVGEDDVAEDWTKKWDEAVVWSDKGKQGSADLVNGNHRLQIIQGFIMKQAFVELEKLLKKGDTGNAEKIKAELRLKSQWTARLINLDKVNKIEDKKKKQLLLDKLSKNNQVYQKPDSIIERISNMGSWLLQDKLLISEVVKKLQDESKEIPNTSKSQKGVLLDVPLVIGICSITQLDYFKQPGHLKITELNLSRAFGCPMVIPLVLMGAKFYMSLTLPTPAKIPRQRKDLYKSINQVEMLDPNLQLKILDTEFFYGLDKLFMDHLFPSFQAFGMIKVPITEYNQNKAPSLDDEDEETKDDEEREEIISLNWRKQFDTHYIPAVGHFVAKWVIERKKVLHVPSEIKALDALEKKVTQYVMIEDSRIGIRDVPWHADGLGVPLVTPSFLTSLMSQLNAVEDASISLLILLEPMAWTKVKDFRPPNSRNFVQVLEAWIKNTTKNNHRLLTRKVTTSFLGGRLTGLSQLNNYLQQKKFVPEEKEYITMFNGEGGGEIHDLATWEDHDLDVLALNNLMNKLRRLQKETTTTNVLLEEQHFEEYLSDSQDKDRAGAIRAMMMASEHPWGRFKSSEFAKVGSKQSKYLFQAYERAQHIWKGVEQIPEVKKLWLDIYDYVKDHSGCLWVDLAGWELRHEMEIIQGEDESLDYLAPLQQNMAMQEKNSVQKETVNKMNRIMMDTLAIAGVPKNDEVALPEEVMGPLKQLIQQLGYCSLNRINSFESKKKLKELDSMTMAQIQHQLTQQGLRSKILDGEVISKISWKQTISLPKGKDFDEAIKKRAGIILDKKKEHKKKKMMEKEDVVMNLDHRRKEDVEMEKEHDERVSKENVPSMEPQDVDMMNSDGVQEKEKSETPETPTCGQPRNNQGLLTQEDLDIAEDWDY